MLEWKHNLSNAFKMEKSRQCLKGLFQAVGYLLKILKLHLLFKTKFRLQLFPVICSQRIERMEMVET